jgi:hypothetical protein
MSTSTCAVSTNTYTITIRASRAHLIFTQLSLPLALGPLVNILSTMILADAQISVRPDVLCLLGDERNWRTVMHHVHEAGERTLVDDKERTHAALVVG